MAPVRAMRPIANLCSNCARKQIRSRRFSATVFRRDAQESNLPRVAQPTFWASLIPRSLRSSPSTSPPTASKPWNPATIFIFLGILVGSNAINLIALRNEMLNFSRKTEAKLSLLREVVQRIKDGEENVDVRGLLGTGDPKSEAEWEEVMKELEGTDMVAEGKRKREERRRERAKAREEADAEKKRERAERQGDGGDGEEGKKGGGRPKFMM